MTLRLATCRALLPTFHDDAPLVPALAARGIEARGMAWQDIGGDDPVLVRSVWDYTTDVHGFRAWLDRLDAAGAAVWNPTETMRWNLDKRYMLELEDAGHTIVPTRVIGAFDGEAVAAIADEAGWDGAVAKPVQGAGAEGLVVVGQDGVRDFSLAGNTWGDFDARPRGACLVQPLVREIAHGEWSLVYVDGGFSHAVLKRPAAGDIRVQEEHGATTEAARPPDHVRRAGDAVAAERPELLFQRIDGVDTPAGFWLMELELIEPELYFRYAPGAIDRLADAIARRMRD